MKSNFSIAMFLLLLVSHGASAMNILLTNDDGYGTYGLVALQKALVKDGHKVFVVAPSSQQSGKSGSINAKIGQTINYTVEVPGAEWSVEGTPADSVNAGLNAFLVDEKIELVVSGANEGENVGRMTNASGTVGAAMYALRHGLPSIAVSVGADFNGLGALMKGKAELDTAIATGDQAKAAELGARLKKLKGSVDQRQHGAADYAGAVLIKIMKALGPEGLPQGLSLNVNVPGSANLKSDQRGLRLVRSDNATPADLKMVFTDSTRSGTSTDDAERKGKLKLDIHVDRRLAAAASGKASCEKLAIDLDSEAAALACGLTTIAIFDGNFDATVEESVADSVRDLACRLSVVADAERFSCQQ